MFRRHAEDVLKGGQYYFLPAQINAVDSDTKLVTLTVRGNDVFYVRSLTAWAFANDPSHVPFLARASGMCRGASADRIEQNFQVLPDNLTAIVEEIHRR